MPSKKSDDQQIDAAEAARLAHAVRTEPHTARDLLPRTTATPDLYGPQPNPGYVSPASTQGLHPEQEGWLSELAAEARDHPESLEALAAVVHELVRMVRHDDIASKSKGLPY